jgi:hypothetical protein
VTSGKRFTPQQIEAAVDAVTVDEIKRVAQKYLWDKDVRCDLFNYRVYSLNSLFYPDCDRGCWKHRGSPGLQPYPR